MPRMTRPRLTEIVVTTVSACVSTKAIPLSSNGSTPTTGPVAHRSAVPLMRQMVLLSEIYDVGVVLAVTTVVANGFHAVSFTLLDLYLGERCETIVPRCTVHKGSQK